MLEALLVVLAGLQTLLMVLVTKYESEPGDLCRHQDNVSGSMDTKAVTETVGEEKEGKKSVLKRATVA